MRSYTLILPVLLLAACQPPPQFTGQQRALEQSDDAETRPDTPVAKAITVFDRVCVRTIPDFANAGSTMAEEGLNIRLSTGTVHHPDLNLSAQVLRGLEGAKTCSVVFRPGEGADAARDRFLSYAASLFGGATKMDEASYAFRDDDNFYLAQFRVTPIGGLVNFRLMKTPAPEES